MTALIVFEIILKLATAKILLRYTRPCNDVVYIAINFNLSIAVGIYIK